MAGYSSSQTYTVNGKPASQQEYEAARENARQNGGLKHWTDNPDHQYYTKAWDAYGGAPNAQPKGSEDGSQAWKNISRARKFPTMDMQNPVQIDGWWYDKPIPKAEKKPAPNLSGGQATVPSVQQRMMSRMGQAVEKGVNKGKIKSNQLAKYQAPGQTAPASPLVNQLGNPEPNYQFNYRMPNKNLPDANGLAYRGTAGNDQLATRELITKTPASTEEFVTKPRPAANGYKTPVPMPQRRQ